MGNYGMVMGASYHAKSFAYCYTKSKKANLTSKFAEIVGNFVALDQMARNKAGGGVSYTQAKYAITLLRYAKQHGEKHTELLSEVEALVPKDEKVNLDKYNVIKATAFEFVEKRVSNKLRFKRDYKGKTLEATGKVVKIYDFVNDSVKVTLLGTNKDIDSRMPIDNLDCVIPKGSKSIDKAMDLVMEQTVTVLGVFKKFGIMGQIELTQCSIK
jgi:hypothetical protein